MAQRKKTKSLAKDAGYDELLSGISEFLDAARHTVARQVNSVLTATYWEIGRRIVEHEQGGSIVLTTVSKSSLVWQPT